MFYFIIIYSNQIKQQLHNTCVTIVHQKIDALKKSLNEVQEAANNETKSSAGDKHETGRAMAQLETEKLTKQLSEVLKLEQVLAQINPKETHQIASLGSVVVTNNGIFYIAVSLGKFELENQPYFVVSTSSPIGKLLVGLQEKATFTCNGKNYTVEKVT